MGAGSGVGSGAPGSADGDTHAVAELERRKSEPPTPGRTMAKRRARVLGLLKTAKQTEDALVEFFTDVTNDLPQEGFCTLEQLKDVTALASQLRHQQQLSKVCLLVMHRP